MGYSFYEIAVKNKWLFTDEEAKKRLKTGEYKLVADYGIDEKFLVYVPYIPLKII
jgi:hypothetical protein